jgi:hypothetical protein
LIYAKRKKKKEKENEYSQKKEAFEKKPSQKENISFFQLSYNPIRIKFRLALIGVTRLSRFI